MKRPLRVSLLLGPLGGLTWEAMRGVADYVRLHGPWEFYSYDEPMIEPMPPLKN